MGVLFAGAFGFALILAILVLDLSVSRAVFGVCLSAGVCAVLSLVIGWIVFLAVKAGVPVAGPELFLWIAYAVTSVIRMALAIREHFRRLAGARGQVLNAIGGSWLVLVVFVLWRSI